MVEKKIKKIREAEKKLDLAMQIYEKESKVELKGVHFLAVVKSFEVLVEYYWKFLKTKVEGEGLDAPSPKEAIRKSARLGFIDKPEKWIECINARNLSVHDYFGLNDKQFLVLLKEFREISKDIL